MIEAKGEPPEPRYGHTMDMFPVSRILAIYGGVNNCKFVDGQSTYYQDLCVFNLVSFEWIKVECYALNPVPRMGHGSTLVGSKLLIYGGMNQKGFVKGQVQYVELNLNLFGLVQSQKIQGIK